jgi:hypothetical protein
LERIELSLFFGDFFLLPLFLLLKKWQLVLQL